MSEVTPLTLQQMVTELSAHGNLRTGGGLSANTVNAIVTVIQAALQVAYRLGYLPDYTADQVKRPKTAEKQIECFTVEEQKDRGGSTCRQAPEDVRNRALSLHRVAHRGTARA